LPPVCNSTTHHLMQRLSSSQRPSLALSLFRRFQAQQILRRRPLVLAAGIVFVLAFAGAGLLVLGHAPRTGNEAVVRDRTLEAVPSPSPTVSRFHLNRRRAARKAGRSFGYSVGASRRTLGRGNGSARRHGLRGRRPQGQTFADIFVGKGSHRIVVIAPGHRMFREVADTTAGMIIRRTLVPVLPPAGGNGVVSVDCRSAGRLPVLPTFPISIDNEETGILCPPSSSNSRRQTPRGHFRAGGRSVGLRRDHGRDWIEGSRGSFRPVAACRRLLSLPRPSVRNGRKMPGKWCTIPWRTLCEYAFSSLAALPSTIIQRSSS